MNQISREVNQHITGDGNYVSAGNININYQLNTSVAYERKILVDLLDKMERFWLKSFLEPLKKIWFDLDTESAPGAINHPLAVSIDRTHMIDAPCRSSDLTIKEQYFEANRALLILGEPGAGKTIALLELTEELTALARASPEFTEPVPVVLQLGTWNKNHQSFRHWLIAELGAKYFIAQRTAASFLDTQRLALLLDGFDEVSVDQHADCVQAINEYCCSVGIAGLVICSRLQDYQNLVNRSPNNRLNLYAAITLKPLSQDQIDQYLLSFDERFVDLRHTLDCDAALQELARNPLMLNIMAATYDSVAATAANDCDLKSTDQQRERLFDTYIQHMIARKRSQDSEYYTDEQVFGYLSWLAKQTHRHQQTVFLLEQIQPSWLEKKLHLWLYFAVSRGLVGLIFGLVIALSEIPEQSNTVIAQPLNKLVLGALLGLLAGLVMACVDYALGKCSRLNTLDRWSRKLLRFVIMALILGGFSFLILAHCEAIIWGILGGLFFCTRLHCSNLETDIQPLEHLRWLWRDTLKGFLIGGVVGALIAGLVALLYQDRLRTLEQQDPFYLVELIVIFIAFSFLFGSLIGTILGSFRSQSITHRVEPNQGIHQTFFICCRMMVITAVVIGLFSLIIWLLGMYSAIAIVIGLIIIIAMGLHYGGISLIRHYILRLLLIMLGYTPRNYVRLLNYACDLTYLRQVGGGYLFIHDLLRQHFAIGRFSRYSTD